MSYTIDYKRKSVSVFILKRLTNFTFSLYLRNSIAVKRILPVIDPKSRNEIKSEVVSIYLMEVLPQKKQANLSLYFCSEKSLVIE